MELLRFAIMATYQGLSMSIAGEVASGTLAPGETLPSVRAFASRHGTTTATVARAYRRLADAGVIETGDRRRARVAVAGPAAAARLLGSGLSPRQRPAPPAEPARAAVPALRLAGSDDPGLDIAVRGAGGSVVTVGPRGSFYGLTSLWRGTAEAAAIHLRHHSGAYNAPFAAQLLRGHRPAVIHVWRREQGIITAEGGPARLADLGRGAYARFARRQFGSGTRVLLDRLLAEAGVPEDAVRGPEAATHLEVALSVAAGQAAAGLAVHAAATALGLSFTPLAWEDFDIVLSADALCAAEPLIAALRDPGVQEAVGTLGGYDVSRAGSVQLLE
ncbi:MAG: Periplasmic molybdate-binding protein/domain [Actinomycetia bacterium]|nr:Periplasmic molybdate-binding protein/domain [Actinomycetes bacterium]